VHYLLSIIRIVIREWSDKVLVGINPDTPRKNERERTQ